MSEADIKKTNWSQSVGGKGFELTPYNSKTPGRNLYI